MFPPALCYFIESDATLALDELLELFLGIGDGLDLDLSLADLEFVHLVDVLSKVRGTFSS